jgi:NADH-quinone oxidoreductase subunit M
MLAWTIYVSFIGVLVLMLLPREAARAARIIALLTAIAGCVVAFAGAAQQANPGEVTTIVKVPWIPSIGASYYLAADGISLVLVVLTGLAAIAGILFSWNIEKRTKEFFAFYLALIGGVYGVFLSFDVLLLFVFYELTIIPKYFLIARWGSTRKEYGAMKLALYSFVGSHLVLIGLIAAWVVARAQTGHPTLDLMELSRVSFPLGFQHWVFPLVFVGFGILAGLWPFHTWAPTGHVAAPTAGSMLLAGVVMKLGAYGCLRVAMVLFPDGVRMWQGEIATLAVIGIVYGAGVALVQKDFKFVIGYSSVSHMGFVLLGLATLNTIGLSGAVLQMFSHGIIAGLLFAVVGRMVYDRTHTRDFNDLQTMQLGRRLPFAGVTFVLAGVASMGLPGFSGFVAELQVLMGAWTVFPVATILSGLGIIVGVAYILRAMQKAFFSDSEERRAPARLGSRGDQHAGAVPGAPMEPISVPERIGAVLLIAASLVIGLFPGLLLNWIQPCLNSPLFERLLKGGSL